MLTAFPLNLFLQYSYWCWCAHELLNLFSRNFISVHENRFRLNRMNEGKININIKTNQF